MRQQVHSSNSKAFQSGYIPAVKKTIVDIKSPGESLKAQLIEGINTISNLRRQLREDYPDVMKTNNDKQQ